MYDSKQAVIAAIREWFYRPGAVFGVDTIGNCVYRGNDDPSSNVRCAMGCLVPDDRYDSLMEGATASAVLRGLVSLQLVTPGSTPQFRPLSDLFPGIDGAFLDELQKLHDDAASSDSNVQDFLVSLEDFEAQHAD